MTMFCCEAEHAKVLALEAEVERLRAALSARGGTDDEAIKVRLVAANRKVAEYERDGVPVATEVTRSLDDLTDLLVARTTRARQDALKERFRDGPPPGTSCLVCGYIDKPAVWSSTSGVYACLICRDAGQAARAQAF